MQPDNRDMPGQKAKQMLSPIPSDTRDMCEHWHVWGPFYE
jgi:hypothetical protein